LKNMKKGKAPGDDEILTEVLKLGGDVIITQLADLFTQCLREGRVPDNWCNAVIILLHKKGSITDLGNYRPISLLSNIYKLFTKVLTNRLTHTLDFNQPREQAGFRSGYSTTDHLHVVNQLIEKANEYQLPLCLAFIDYEKAFDSIEVPAVLQALIDQGIDDTYVNIIKDIYSKGTAIIQLHTESNKINIQRGVRQGDTMSPKLFNAALEAIIRKLDWEEKGININGERLSHLRFADDIVIFSENPDDLESMLQDLNSGSNQVGLKINMKKTKTMFNKFISKKQIHIQHTAIEEVEDYIYLGQLIKMDHRQYDEVRRRVRSGWGAFGKLNEVMQSNMPLCLKRKVFNQCVLPAMTYGSETWSMTQKMEQRLRVTQHSMERSMLGITKRDRKTNEWIRSMTQVDDIIQTVKQKKWSWAGHLARTSDGRWTKLITEWIPRNGSRHPGRQKTRWRDEITKFLDVTWMRKAQDRSVWCHIGEAFTLQWVDHG